MVDPTNGLQYDIGQGYSAADAQAARSRLDGYAVVTGLTPTAGSSGLEVDVASGEALVGTDANDDPLRVSVGATTVTLSTADSQYPRKDVVYVDDAGTVQVAEGTADPPLPETATLFNTYQPEPPLVRTGAVLAEVFVAAGATTLGSADVRDRRQPAQVVGEEVAAETLRAATFGRDVDAQGNDITGIGTAEADSVNTERVSIGTDWTDVTSNRSFDTWYQAPTDSDIEFAVTANIDVGTTDIDLLVNINDTQNPMKVGQNRFVGLQQDERPSIGSYTVPADSYYQVRALEDTADYSLRTWAERR